jgi:hypothetical protein
MVRRVVTLMTLAAIVAPCAAQEPDTGVVAQFMTKQAFVARHGAWFKKRDLDPLTDSLKAYIYIAFSVRGDLAGFDTRDTSFAATFAIECLGPTPSFLLTASDDTSHFESSDVWVRYRVDARPASEWEKWKGAAKGRFIVAVSQGLTSGRLRDAMLNGSRKLLVRVRAGREERDYFFLLNGFALAYADCAGR